MANTPFARRSGRKGAASPNKTESAIPLWQTLHKYVLRAWPSENGDVLQHDFFKNDLEALESDELLRIMSSHNSELLHRAATGISETSACIAGPIQSVLSSMRPHSDRPGRDGGIGEVGELFRSREGADFLYACEKLNAGKEPSKLTRDEAEEHIGIWVGFLREHGAACAKDFRKLAVFSSRLYVASMAMLQAGALANAPAEWARMYSPKLRDHRWFQNPAMAEELVAFLVNEYTGAHAQAREAANRPRAPFTLDDEDAVRRTAAPRAEHGAATTPYARRAHTPAERARENAHAPQSVRGGRALQLGARASGTERDAAYVRGADAPSGSGRGKGAAAAQGARGVSYARDAYAADYDEGSSEMRTGAAFAGEQESDGGSMGRVTCSSEEYVEERGADALLSQRAAQLPGEGMIEARVRGGGHSRRAAHAQRTEPRLLRENAPTHAEERGVRDVRVHLHGTTARARSPASGAFMTPQQGGREGQSSLRRSGAPRAGGGGTPGMQRSLTSPREQKHVRAQVLRTPRAATVRAKRKRVEETASPASAHAAPANAGSMRAGARASLPGGEVRRDDAQRGAPPEADSRRAERGDAAGHDEREARVLRTPKHARARIDMRQARARMEGSEAQSHHPSPLRFASRTPESMPRDLFQSSVSRSACRSSALQEHRASSEKTGEGKQSVPRERRAEGAAAPPLAKGARAPQAARAKRVQEGRRGAKGANFCVGRSEAMPCTYSVRQVGAARMSRLLGRCEFCSDEALRRAFAEPLKAARVIADYRKLSAAQQAEITGRFVDPELVRVLRANVGDDDPPGSPEQSALHTQETARVDDDVAEQAPSESKEETESAPRAL